MLAYEHVFDWNVYDQYPDVIGLYIYLFDDIFNLDLIIWSTIKRRFIFSMAAPLPYVLSAFFVLLYANL